MKGKRNQSKRAEPASGDTAAFVSRPAVRGGAPPRFKPETELGRFRVEAFLGAGSLGDVYRARDTLRDRVLAIKVVNAMRPDAADALRRERDAYDAVQDHTHVLKAYDLHSVTCGGAALLVLSMEYADGGTFRRWLKQHRNAPDVRRDQGIDCFRQICEGVAASHDAGVVVRDLKPENFLFVSGLLKIADLGAACVEQAPAQVSSQELDTGTPVYMSPEHFGANVPGRLDPRSDIYSLGIILYEILHPEGKAPFIGPPSRLRQLHTKARPPAVPGACDGHRKVIERCLAKEPAGRYAGVCQLLDELEGRYPQDEELWQTVLELAEKKRFDESQRLCRQIVRRQPNHEDANALLEELLRRAQRAAQLYSAIGENIGDWGLDESMALVREAMELYPDHPDGPAVQVRLAARARTFRRCMHEGIASIERGNWEAALGSLQQARDADPGSVECENALRSVTYIVTQLQESQREIDEALAAGNGQRAMALAEAVDDFLEQARDSIPSGERQ